MNLLDFINGGGGFSESIQRLAAGPRTTRLASGENHMTIRTIAVTTVLAAGLLATPAAAFDARKPADVLAVLQTLFGHGKSSGLDVAAAYEATSVRPYARIAAAVMAHISSTAKIGRSRSRISSGLPPSWCM